MEYRDINDFEVLYLVEEKQSDYKELLFKKYEPILKKLSYEYYYKIGNNGIEYDDVYQEALIGLNYAIDHFDIDKNNKFYTYAIICIKGKLNSFLVKNNTKYNRVLNDSLLLTQYTDIDIDNLEVVKFDDTYLSFYNKIIDFKNNLNDVQAQIFELKYNGFSNNDIGILLELDVKNVYYNLCFVRKKLIINGF